MLKEPVHPAERYVNLFLLELMKAEKAQVVRRSLQLPELRGHAPPDFARFRNRLKIMADLDPVIYPTPRSGSLNIMIMRQVDDQWYDCYYLVRVSFNDVGDDPSVELSAELTRKEPGVDPDLCMY